MSLNSLTSMTNPTKEHVTSKATNLGILLALGWLLVTFMQVEAELYLFIGALNVLINLYSRFHTRKEENLELEGHLFGFSITWTISSFVYLKSTAVLQFGTVTLQVRQIMIVYLLVVLCNWFFVKKASADQEVIFGLSPLYSYILLNLWKLSVLLEFTKLFPELLFLSAYIDLFFLFCGFFDLSLSSNRQFKLDYLDIMLNPIQLLIGLVSGPLQCLKWVLFLAIFRLLVFIYLDWWMLLLGLCAIFVSITTLTTFVAKLTKTSGIFDSKIDEGKKIFPKMMKEVQNLSVEDFHNYKEYYAVLEPTTIQTKHSTVNIPLSHKIMRVPISDGLQEQTGVLLAVIKPLKKEKDHKNQKDKKPSEIKQEIKKEIAKEIKKQREEEMKKGSKPSKSNHPWFQWNFDDGKGSNINFSLSRDMIAIHRVTVDEWKSLQKKLQLISREQFATELGFENTEEFDAKLTQGIQQATLLQEQIRARIRGLPAPSLSQKSFHSKFEKTGELKIPTELLTDKNIDDNTELEIIPGNDEYLFYVRKKVKK